MTPSTPDPRGGVVARGTTSSLTYAAIGIAQRAVALLLLPVFAQVLTPDEYGQIALVVSISALVGSLLTLGLEAPVVRTAVRLSDNEPERERFVNTMGMFTLATTIVISLVIAAGVALVGDRSLIADSDLIALGIAGAGIQASLSVFVGALLRAQERLRAYALVAATQTVATAVLTLSFVALLHLGPFGWMLGVLVATAGSLLVGLVVLGHRWTRTFSRPDLATALVFGLPLLPHALSHWALNLSDRLVLGSLVDAAQVGVYNLAYQIAAPIGLVLVAVNQGVIPLYAEASKRADTRSALPRLATYHLHVAVFLGVAAAVVGPPLVLALFPGSYAGAAAFVPWVAVGFVFYGTYLIPANIVSMQLGETRWLWVPTALAALTNIGLNLLLIPWLGALAAAINTAVAYGVLLVGVILYRSRLGGPTLRFEWRHIAIGSAILVAFGGATIALVPGSDGIGSVALRSVGVLAGGGVLLWLHLRHWHRGPRRATSSRPPEKTHPVGATRG